MPSVRSSLFHEWLHQQPLARQKEIRAAESKYATDHTARLAAAEEVFQDSMHGFEDTPPGVIAENPLLGTRIGGSGDWSWQPWRYAKDPGHVFTSAEIDVLYPGRVYRPNARFS